MCLILFAYHCHVEYPLLLAANRDEYHLRETAHADWWRESPELLAGRDLEAGGTWMGITRTGRIAALTNIREPQLTTPSPCSRGLLTRRYLEENIDDERFSGLLQQTGEQYRGYNLLFGSLDRLYYYSNRSTQVRQLPPGIYGLSNAELNTPWPKVQRGKQLLQQLLKPPHPVAEELLSILSSTLVADDQELPDTGVGLEWERRLSAIRIIGPTYGTRASTALLIDRDNQVQFLEQTLAPTAAVPRLFRFQIGTKKQAT